MSVPTERDRLLGAVCALGSASAFGVTIVVQRRLAGRGLGVTTALGVRFGLAALILLALLAVTRGPLLPARGERVRSLGLGAVGYATEAGLFYLALQRGSAGAVALLFYAYPAGVVLVEWVTGGSRPRLRTWLALLLSSAGAALVVAGGSEVVISAAGVGFALASAACFAVYMVSADRLVKRSDPRSSSAWVAGGASLALLTTGAVVGALEAPGGRWPLLVLNAAATAAAFALLYAALPRLGAGPTAVVMTMEAFVALLLAVPVLGETLGPVQILGGAAIVAGAVVVSRRPKVEAAGP